MLVKIKTWAQMEKEFGLNKRGQINTSEHVFSRDMELQMPQNRIVKKVAFGCWEGSDNGIGKMFIITDDMIVP